MKRFWTDLRKMKLWQKDYELNKQIEKFTVGNDPLIDLNLVEYDCIASTAQWTLIIKCIC